MCFAICVCCDFFFFETSLRLGHTTISQLVLQVGGLLPFWNPTNPRRSGIGKMWSTGSGTQGACVQPPGPIATCLAARPKMSWWRKRMRAMRPLPLSRLRLLPLKKSRMLFWWWLDWILEHLLMCSYIIWLEFLLFFSRLVCGCGWVST